MSAITSNYDAAPPVPPATDGDVRPRTIRGRTRPIDEGGRPEGRPVEGGGDGHRAGRQAPVLARRATSTSCAERPSTTPQTLVDLMAEFYAESGLRPRPPSRRCGVLGAAGRPRLGRVWLIDARLGRCRLRRRHLRVRHGVRRPDGRRRRLLRAAGVSKRGVGTRRSPRSATALCRRGVRGHQRRGGRRKRAPLRPCTGARGFAMTDRRLMTLRWPPLATRSSDVAAPSSPYAVVPKARAAVAEHVTGRQVALLRGINVGAGQAGRHGRPARAGRRASASAQCARCSTAATSSTAAPGVAPAEAAARIEAALPARLGVSARVVALERRRARGSRGRQPSVRGRRQPFAPAGRRARRPAVSRPARAAGRARLGRRSLVVGARVAYLWCPDGVIASALAAAVDRALGDAVTSRNWTTMVKLAALAAGASRLSRVGMGTNRLEAFSDGVLAIIITITRARAAAAARHRLRRAAGRSARSSSATC